VDGDASRLLLEIPYILDEVHVSPDGGLVAYNANESGRWEVYVARFPEFNSKRQVSRDGGVQPQWSGDGRELFYFAGDGSMRLVHQYELDTQHSRACSGFIDCAHVPVRGHRRQAALPRARENGGNASLTFLLNGLDGELAGTTGMP
jgi:hypothetical protein